MRLLVPISGTPLSAVALDGALVSARPGDAVIVAAAVVAPPGLPPDAPALRRSVHRAERVLAAARAAGFPVPSGVDVCFVAARAKTRAESTIAVATRERADVIVLAARDGLFGAVAAWMAAVRLVQRGAPCPVRLVSAGGMGGRDVAH